MKKALFALFAMLLVQLSIPVWAQPKHTFEIGEKAFLLDGKPIQFFCGEIHPYRVPAEYWKDRLQMIRAMGMNSISIYMFWNVHEPQKGKYNFSGSADIARFVKLAQEAGLWVILRPSPYACAEWEFGGYPWWLLKEKDVKVRSKDPRFIEVYKNYIAQVAKHLAPLQVQNGGPILMVQIENEYGFYGNDNVDARDLRLFRVAGGDALDIEGAPTDESRHMRQDARLIVDQHGKQVFLHLIFLLHPIYIQSQR